MSPSIINTFLLTLYTDKLISKRLDPEQITSPYFRKVYMTALEMAAANIHPAEACIVATTTTETAWPPNLNKKQELPQPALRQVEGWNACRMIATGGFRLGTSAENDRYQEEQLARELECRTITENTQDQGLKMQREEAKNTRDLLTSLIGAAAANAGIKSSATAVLDAPEPESNKRGPGRPPLNKPNEGGTN